MMQISIIHPFIHRVIHVVSDVIIRIIPIIKKCAKKQKTVSASIHFLLHSMDNRVFRDNSPVGQWIMLG